MLLSDAAEQRLSRGLLHLDVGKEFLSGILQAGPEKIDHIVDDEKAVVIVLGGTYINRWVLLIVTLDVKLLLLGEMTCVYGCRHIGCSLAQHGQSIDIDIIIDEYDGLPGLFDKTDDVGVGIEDLSVVEDTLNRW